MKIGLIVATLSFFVVVIVLAFVFRAEKPLSVVNESTSDNSAVLTVPPQKADTTVFIERIDIPQPGFIAVRSLENGRLGQIIEISPYLSVGKHENITIDLGDFYDGNTNLAVVVYEDAESDRIFNDIDQPMRDANELVIAKYVSTGENVASELFTNTGEPTPHTMGRMKMETVRYTNRGYVPAELEISVHDHLKPTLVGTINVIQN